MISESWAFCPETCAASGFAAIEPEGADGIIVANNPINDVDPEGLNPTSPTPSKQPAPQPCCPPEKRFQSWWDCFTFYASEYGYWGAHKGCGPIRRYIEPPHCPFYRIAWGLACRKWKELCKW